MISVLLLCWDQVGVMTKWFVKVPMIRDLAEEAVALMDQLLMISVLLVCWETGWGYI